MEYIIDAKLKTLGRISSEAAKILMGKNLPTYERNKVSKNKVKIINASQILLSSKKLQNKKYKSYSGYPGGLKERILKDVLEKKGIKDIILRSLKGMLPKNKLKKEMLKNITIIE